MFILIVTFNMVLNNANGKQTTFSAVLKVIISCFVRVEYPEKRDIISEEMGVKREEV